MEKIIPYEYEKAKKTVEQYESQLKCKHINTKHIFDYNSFPYGEDFEFDKCNDCGEIINIRNLR